MSLSFVSFQSEGWLSSFHMEISLVICEHEIWLCIMHCFLVGGLGQLRNGLLYMHIVCIKINVLTFSTGTCLQIEEIQQYCDYLKILVI